VTGCSKKPGFSKQNEEKHRGHPTLALRHMVPGGLVGELWGKPGSQVQAERGVRRCEHRPGSEVAAHGGAGRDPESDAEAAAVRRRAAPGGARAHGPAGLPRPRAACWRSRAAPPRSLARQLAAAWRVVTAPAGGQRLPGTAGRRTAALRGDGFARLRPTRARTPGRKDKDTRVRIGQARGRRLPRSAPTLDAPPDLSAPGKLVSNHRSGLATWETGSKPLHLLMLFDPEIPA
jgi:hypothetical protein